MKNYPKIFHPMSASLASTATTCAQNASIRQSSLTPPEVPVPQEESAVDDNQRPAHGGSVEQAEQDQQAAVEPAGGAAQKLR